MAQIIKHKRGSLEKLSSVTGSLQKGELVIATGSVKLGNVTNGEALVFAAYESGAVSATNRILRGDVAPIFSASTYNGMLDGVPFYASASNTLFLLGSDTNEAIDLSGNISDFSSSVSASISNLSSSIQSVTGDFSSSVATSFSASAFTVSQLSSSVASDLNSLSGSLTSSIGETQTSITNLSSSVSNISGAFATSTSASKAEYTSFSASAASDLNTLSGSLTSSIGSTQTSITNLSSSVNNISGAFATSTSASNAAIASLSASVASVTGDFSSSVATSFSASAASQTALSGAVATTVSNLSSSIATTDNNQTDRIVVLEASQSAFDTAFQLTGSSVTILGDLKVNGTTTQIDSTTLNIGDNIISLNGAGGTFGGIEVKDPTAPNTLSGSLLWDTTNDYWIAGAKGSESKVLVAVGDNIVSSSTQITISNTTGYSTFSSSIATDFSASKATVTELSTSVDGRLDTLEASLGGGGAIGTRVSNLETISASYLAFTQSYYSDSSSFVTAISASDAEYTSFSASAATSFSASAFIATVNSASAASDLNSVSGAFVTTISNLSSSIATTDSASAASQTALSGAVATTITNLSSSLATTDSASVASITSVSASLSSVSGAFATSTSASNYQITELSASVASVGGTFSASVATDFSASTAARVALSASIATTDNAQSDRLSVIESTYATTGSNVFNGDQTITGSISVKDVSSEFKIEGNGFGETYLQTTTGDLLLYARNGENPATVNVKGGNLTVDGTISGSIVGIGNVTTFSTSVDSRFSSSAYNVAELSASVASVGGTFSSSVATNFSASTAARVALSASVSETINTLSTSVDSRLSSEEFKSTTFATTGSNVFKGEQIISSSLIVTNEIKGTGSIFLQPNVDDARKVEIYNTGASDVHIKGTTGLTFLGDDTNYVAINDSAQTITITGSNGVYVGGIAETIGAFSQSVNSRFSSSAYEVSQLSASVASVGGTFSSSVATDFSASTAARVALSASIATTDNTQTGRIDALESYSSSLKTAIELTGSSVTIQGDLLVRGTTTSVNSTTIELGDNIIELNGTGATNGGLYVKDVTSPNTATGSLLWDSTNDYWKAGVKDSESKVLLAVGDSVVSASAQITLSSTTGFNTFDTAISTSFSASAYNVASLSASVASVTGDFSSSVATSFSASAFTTTQLSASIASDLNSVSGAFATSTSASNAAITSLSASVASVTGDFSSSVATSFSASAASVTALSASIYLTDATQSTDITNNSSSFATSISASNFRITILETTIDGGSY
jgi:hypothetical protein